MTPQIEVVRGAEFLRLATRLLQHMRLTATSGGIWEAADVQWWYKQNMFLVVHESVSLPPAIEGRRMPENADTHAHPEMAEFYRQLYLDEAVKTRQLQTELKDIVWGDKRPIFYIRGLLKTVRNLFR